MGCPVLDLVSDHSGSATSYTLARPEGYHAVCDRYVRRPKQTPSDRSRFALGETSRGGFIRKLCISCYNVDMVTESTRWTWASLVPGCLTPAFGVIVELGDL